MYNLVSSSPKNREVQSFQRSRDARSYGKNKVHDSILDFVGNTPMIRLNKIPKDHGVACDIYVKCEYMNPAGSSKDRVARTEIEEAIKQGVINEQSILVETTSGNTGIGIAFDAALKGYKCTLVTNAKTSSEKINTMSLLGAEVIQVKDLKTEDQVARRLKELDPHHVVMLSQFENEVNPITHYNTTAVEIMDALSVVDMVVMTAGTGGTMSGVTERLKERNPDCKLVAAEPEGSTMFNTNGKAHPFLVEGIGGSKVPIVLDKSLVDHLEVISDQDSFMMAREAARKEGLLCGGSSGTALAAAIRAAKFYKLGAGKSVVVILPDGIRNYMTKFVTDQWMEAFLLKDPPNHTMSWWKKPITELTLHHKYPVISDTSTCYDAVAAMKDVDIAVVTNKKGWFVGAVSKDGFRNYATNPTKLPEQDSEDMNFNSPVTDYLHKDTYTLAKNGKKGMPTIGRLSRILDITPFVVIGKDGKEGDTDFFLPESVATADDVLSYIAPRII